jgi:hypothetical protein
MAHGGSCFCEIYRETRFAGGQERPKVFPATIFEALIGIDIR